MGPAAGGARDDRACGVVLMAHREEIIIRRPQVGLLDRLRSIVLGPWNPRDREIARYFGGHPVSSGVSVNETTAMNYSAVFAAVNLISSTIASVPLFLYK